LARYLGRRIDGLAPVSSSRAGRAARNDRARGRVADREGVCEGPFGSCIGREGLALLDADLLTTHLWFVH
jgi:hypothetical protein